MAAILVENLQALHDIYRQSGASGRDQIDGSISDITQICLHEISDKDKDFCCSALFDQETGIVAFMKKIVADNEFQNSKAAILDLLSGFAQKVGKKIQPYALDIKEVCVFAFARDRFAKVKNAAVSTLIKVMELSVGSQMGKDLNVEKMFEKFFMELTKGSKLSATVKGNIYTLLGVLAEVYPEYAIAYSERLVTTYINALEAEMTSKIRKPELPIIAGCLQGLTALLVNFTQSVDEDSKHSYNIFKNARKAIDPNVDFSRFDVPKAGLMLFSRHAAQFRQYLVDDYKNMYEKLLKWSHHHNREVLHVGEAALGAFLKQVSETITERAKEGNKEGAIFKFFLQEFRNTMSDSGASSKEVSMAVKGYGLLAAPCRTFLTPADVQFMFAEMVTKCEQEFISSQFVDEKLMSLPGYLHALANIIKEVDEVSETFASTLEQLLVALMENIPKIHKPYHFSALKAILHLLLALQTKSNTFNKVLAGFVYQSLIRTCSHPVATETEGQEEESSDNAADLTVRQITYKDFLELWTGLLESAKVKDLAQEGIGLAERHQLTHALYDELMTAILRVIGKLDFTATKEGEGGEASTTDTAGGSGDSERVSTDPVSGIEANRPMDFQVFINLVDFCRDLLVTKQFQRFEKWVFTFTHTIIVQSTLFPLVSGFYKLLAITLKIANRLNYFQGCGLDASNETQSMEVDEEGGESSTQKSSTFLLTTKFSKEVLVRMKQYRDDLLASCLTLILALPKEIISHQMKQIVPAIQLTFTMGLSYLPLAQVGLEALEWWSETLPTEVITPHYADILPCLDAYLKTSDKGAEEVNVESVVSKSNSKSGRRKKKVPIRLVRSQPTVEKDQGYESQLSLVKQRIVMYLGSLGGSTNHHLLSGSEEETSRRAIAWDTNQHLRFDIPFFDMKPVIYFDPFLPRVVELAMQSSDRQTKVVACELLHSLTLYTLGRSAQQPGEQQKRHPMERLYRKMFPALLALACDVEQVCRQLFEPLMMQLIHWFTGNKMGESPETMALLDSIYEGLVQQEDTMLRDFSARCLREFLAWSIKQTSKQTMEKNPVNVKSVLKRMFSFALHPSAFKRLGAALAFNSIYTVLREENSLVDRFTFQILVHFVESLSIAHADEKSLGTQDQCKKALEHLEKIIRLRADLLCKPSKNRTEPSEWSKPTLDIAVRWLTRQCGRPQTECRHTCMTLVYQLAPLIQGIKAPIQYFQAFFKGKEGGAYFVARFEGGGQAVTGKKGLSSCPTLDKMADTFTLPDVLSWFDMLLAALDCYCWVFGEGLIPPDAVFADKENSSRLFESLVYFVERLSLGSLKQAAEQFPGKVEESSFTPKELDDYNRTKCTVIIRLWNFLAILMAKHSKDLAKLAPAKLFGKPLWQLCMCCVIQPSSVGFNMGDVEVIMNLPKEMTQLLTVMSKYLADPQKKQLLDVLKQELHGTRDVFGQLPIGLVSMTTDYTQLQQTVEGYQLLHTVGLLMPAVSEAGKADKLAKDLFDSVFKGTVKQDGDHLTMLSLNPAALKLASCLLDFAFQLQLPGKVLVKSLLDTTPVQGLGQGTRLVLGDHFFTLFKSNIAAYMAVSADVVTMMMEHAGSLPHRVCGVLVAMLEHLARDRSLRKRHGEATVQQVMANWSQIKQWWTGGASADSQSLAVLLLTKLLLVDSKVALDPETAHCTELMSMYQVLLTDRKTNLAFKNRVLDLLPFFAALPKPHDAKLKESLDRFVADNFPLKSSEFVKGTPKYNDYISAVDKLLSALELSCSLVLVELLISVFCREEGRHVHEDAIQDALAAFIKRLPADKQKAAVDIGFNIFAKEGSFPNVIRRATAERVCLPLLRLVHKTALTEFFLDHILDLLKTAELRLSKNPESVVESQLTSKICTFELLEIMYSRLSREEVNSPSSIINRKVCYGSPETGKEMTQKITKAVNEAKSEDTRGETMLPNLRRQYHCYSYNLLCAIITCVQNDSKFYKGFLFQDNVAKGQFLLENFVDKDVKYEFPLEFESRFERKKKFVAIRSEVREKRAEDGDASGSVPSSFYLASQYLTESSLAEDLQKYEFSISGSAQNISSGSRSKGNLRKKDSYSSPDDTEMQVKMEGDYVELEMDGLNAHECMASLIALIKHMHRNSIFPFPQAGVSPKEMPSWMSYLHDKMKNPSENLFNVKIFIAKLIVNTAEIFQPYAKFWLRPLCQLILSPRLSEGGMNYFIMDLIVTMLSWHDTAIPQDSAEERAMASRLVEFLVAFVYHETRGILRNNLEMLKTVLECWKDRIDLPYQQVFKQLKMPDPTSKSSLTGIQVLGVILTCKLNPYGPSAPVDRDRYFNTLATSMTNNSKPIYAAAAEVVGMVLTYLAEKEKDTEGPLYTHIESCLNKVKPDAFIVCVHHMQRHYSPIADRFLNKLLYMLPSLHGEYRSLCLEVIQGRVDHLPNAFMELKSKGLHNFLTHRDEDTQLVSLRIVKSLAPKLEAKDLQSLMRALTNFSSHPSSPCRHTMLDCLMWIYDNYRDNDSPEAVEIMSMTKEALLQALCDDDLHCRLTVQNFWSSETRLPVGTLDRTVAMLEAMYTAGSERHYLSYATNLLLEMTSKSPDYNRHIFEHPLSECTFRDYSLQSSWRQRHAVMTPLFAMTQMSQSQEAMDDSVDGQIRATQDVQQFTATMETGSNAPFNWLTQSSLDTFADFSLSSSESSSSLLFNVGSSGQGSGSRRFIGAAQTRGSGPRDNFGGRMPRPKPAPGSSSREEDDSGDSSDMWRLKRRFIKDKTASNVFFARRQIRLKKMKEEVMKQQRLRRENQVTLYRKYRIGDLPDIQINYSYIIAPLQALAHRDSTVARLLFSAVFKAIHGQMEQVKTEREMEDVKTQINSSLNQMLSASTQYYPPFMACIMDIVYSLRSTVKMDSGELGTAAVVSKLQPLGMEVLEEQLIQQDDGGARAAKRGRQEGTAVSLDVALWTELARLYKSVGDYDVLQGIFSGMLNTKDLTQQAMIKESYADYKAAKALYEEALQRDWDDKPLDAEVDLWEDGRLECLTRMTQWKDLESVVEQGLGAEKDASLDSLWDDPFSMETYLPYLVRSKVKLLLQGDSSQQSLLTFIDNAMKQTDRKLHLENRFSEELALMYIWQQDYDRARHYASQAMNCFLQEWSSTDSLMAGSRASCLHHLQPLVELREFLEFMSDEGNFRSPTQSRQLASKWLQRSPHLQLDSVDIWDDVVTSRNVFLDKICERLQSSAAMGAEEDEDLFEEEKLELHLNMARSCLQQNNFNLTLRILSKTFTKCKQESSGFQLVEWSHLYASTHHKKALTTAGSWNDDTILNVVTTLDQLGKVSDTDPLQERPDLNLHHSVLVGDACHALVTGIMGLDSLSTLKSTTMDKLKRYANFKKLDKNEVLNQLVEHGFRCMRGQMSGSAPQDYQIPNPVCKQEDLQLALAKFCDKYLHLHEDDDEELQLKKDLLSALPSTVVKCMMDAMYSGSSEARERFPRLLQVIENYPDTTELFVEKGKRIPSWMFILWISQMMALMDKEQAPAVRHILLRLAEDYPQAVVYPLRISQEGFIFGSTAADKQNKSGVDKLSALLTDERRVPLVTKFISALDQFAQPFQVCKDWADDMRKVLHKKKPNPSDLKKKYKEMYNNLLEMPAASEDISSTQKSMSSASLNAPVIMGNFRRRFAGAFKKEFDKVFGKEGQKFITMTSKEFSREFHNIQVKFENMKDKRDMVAPTKLAEYCSWMANFNPYKESRELEIPGQYDGLQKPMPEYHVKVAGFDERVLVMSSLRKPKRITIRGNDEKEYHYLVKGGEDLRQDQRIEQLFIIMNRVMEKDAACRARNLHLKTYQVIPMNTRVGLIEWMNNTQPLKDFLNGAKSEEERKYTEGEQGPSCQHNKWVGKFMKKGLNIGALYSLVYQKYSKTETVREFRIKENKIPWNLSRRALQCMSTSVEAFHMLRCAMLTSHAVICICQYLLGIGDRHLSNFMINLKTGQMVGIDFGHAFGTATQFLPVPEMMAVRLTRQIVNVGLPLKVQGTLENTMIHVLRALKQNHDLLLATMDIFVKEVSVDWMQFAEKQKNQGQEPEDAEDDMAWYPKQKVQWAARKLKGDNPCYITRDELRLGHSKNEAIKAFESVVLGDKNENIRAQLPATGLTVEQQVAALIDQATDPNILGRTYSGWEPWV